MVSAIIVCSAIAEDYEEIAAVILPIQQEEFGISITYDQQPDLKNIGNFYQSGKGGFWVALHEDRIVGTAGLIDIGDHQGVIRKMFVAAPFRGPAGVAQKLLQHLLAHAEKQCLKRLYLGTTSKYHAAHRFYEKNKFELIEAEDLPASFPRMEVDTRFYKFELL